MKTGLVFGKFMPLHKGHLALIDFAIEHCDFLYILLCYNDEEPIAGAIRQQWLSNTLSNYKNISIVDFKYNSAELSDSSIASKKISKDWAQVFKQLFPEADIIFTSEAYGSYVAEFMKIKHVLFDKERRAYSISASMIRKFPFKYWDYIAKSAQYFFVKKTVLLGSESTGKSILTEKLAAFFNTAFVKEMAREIIQHTESCTYEHLQKIALLHANTIKEKISEANKILFIDTDINITKSYSQFLFGKELYVDQKIEQQNKSDLYLFLETDSPYIQDGTRLSEQERNRLSEHHKKQLSEYKVNYISITGNWEERFIKSKEIINSKFFK